MDRYQQFCPLALAAEIVTLRWMPLVLRELMYGSARFNEIHRGVPRMSRSLLSRRLTELERAGVVERRLVDGHPEYHLTAAGRELRPVLDQLGAWGKQWVRGEISPDHLDAGLVMWNVQRIVARDRLPPQRAVVRFELADAAEAERRWWLLLERGSVDLCVKDPGYPCDLDVATDVRTLLLLCLRELDFGCALRDGLIRLRGKRALQRQLPAWMGLVPAAGPPASG